jgi:putative addiction module killer protein
MRASLTAVYRDWIDSIDDTVTRARIQLRVDQLLHGHPGRHRRLPGGIWELKMDFGPGYRVYYVERKEELVVLCGGDKSLQQRDIQLAIALARRL